MPFFRHTKQLYTCLEQVFFRIQEEDPKAGQAMTSARLAIRLQTTEPVGEIVINGRLRPVRFYFGQNELETDLDASLTADTLHQILLGELGLREAMNHKQILVRGPVFKTMMLAPLFRHGKRIYPQILREQGLA